MELGSLQAFISWEWLLRGIIGVLGLTGSSYYSEKGNLRRGKGEKRIRRGGEKIGTEKGG